MRAFVLAVLMFVVAAAVLAEAPTRPCLQPAPSWQCVSLIEFRVPDGSLLRATIFDNFELLGEMEQHGAHKRMLIAQPSGVTLYGGLSTGELAKLRVNPLNGPFAFVAEGAAAVPLMALIYAYPDGPRSVPQEQSDVPVIVDELVGSLSVRRVLPGRFAFTLATKGVTFAGIVSTEERPPLPDSFDIANWKRESGPRLKLLGQARKQANPSHD
jgi:hypothetical protein